MTPPNATPPTGGAPAPVAAPQVPSRASRRRLPAQPAPGAPAGGPPPAAPAAQAPPPSSPTAPSHQASQPSEPEERGANWPVIILVALLVILGGYVAWDKYETTRDRQVREVAEAKAKADAAETARREAAEADLAKAKAEAAAEVTKAKAEAATAKAELEKQLADLAAKADKAIADAAAAAKKASEAPPAPALTAPGVPSAPGGLGFKSRYLGSTVTPDTEMRNPEAFTKAHVGAQIDILVAGSDKAYGVESRQPIDGHVIYFRFPNNGSGREYYYNADMKPEDAKLPVDSSRLEAAGYRRMLVSVATQPGDLVSPADKAKGGVTLRRTLAWFKSGAKPSDEEVRRLAEQG